MTDSITGRLIVVVGPSGAGKDSILKGAQAVFRDNPRIEFVRRVITRECDPAAEVHDSVTEAQFVSKERQGEFSIAWRANNLHYGLPFDVFAKIKQGQLVVANGSRAAIPDFRSKFKQLTIVHITVSEDTLAQRLACRSRETSAQITQRLQRNRTIKAIEGDDIVSIDNSAAKEAAVDAFITLLSSY